MINIYYALQYPDGRFVGIDHQSGGYPYPCEHINSAWLLEATEKNLVEMKGFVKSFPRDNFSVVILKISLMNIKVA